MNDLIQQEIFEIEVLAWLKNKGFLRNMIFGGGTMLRLCYGLKRYSVDLDFWIYRVDKVERFFINLKDSLKADYDLTDAQNKYYTLLFEIKKASYPRKLKIEIRKDTEKKDFQEKIAYSPYANQQVLVKTFSLEQMMENKIEALLDRKEIRDVFDIEFLTRKRVNISANYEELKKIREIIGEFKKRDYYVTLGSLLDDDTREYYKKDNFTYLLGIIDEKLSYE
ncbi:MAG: nucleotidyl transferase AbiEii/AbiGii toxin family protein [Candidatus Atribacteria bacterium]|nr:nucleotidyl transferase AbiEii/AbiGii toxin family protein [Candidatus Atribacteria bacterium]